jgi:hypothetical protein
MRREEGGILSHVANPYRLLCKQKVKRYRFELTPSKRLWVFTGVGSSLMGLILALISIFGFDHRRVVDYSDCTEGVCTYTFHLAKDSAPLFIYHRIEGVAQNHMLYTPEEESPTGTCKRYLDGERFVYPCGMTGSTFPDEEIRLFDAEGEEIAISRENINWDAREESPVERLVENREVYRNWRRPSTFPLAHKFAGVVDSLPAGWYRVEISSSHENRIGKRSLLFLSNISPFGTSLRNLEPVFFLVAFLLVMANSFACMYNK